MNRPMKAVSWLVFLTFIGLSSFANWEHGTTRISSFMLAVVPVGFAASIFILEGIVSAGKATIWSYAGITFVAAAAGIASYLGLYGMARDSGIPIVQSALLPLAFDGVVAVASMGIRAFSSPALVAPVPVEEVLQQTEELLQELEKESAPAPEEIPVEDRRRIREEASATAAGYPSRRSAPRSSWDARKVADMLLDGAKTPEIVEVTGAGRASVDRFRSVLRLLQESPRAEVPEKMKVSPDNVKMLRELVLR